MTENPLVSVIINCYNSEKYLRETIDSLISQTYKNWEAIFWNNCSTDKTAEIIASYNEPRFRYFGAEKNTPLGEARNLAMENVQGELLCFLDSDDIWVRDFLKIGVDSLSSNIQCVGFYSNYFKWEANKTSVIHGKNRKEGAHSLKYILNHDYGIGMSACIMRTNIIDAHKIRFDNQYRLIEDMDFFFKVLRYGDFVYNSTPLYYYRIHNDNSSHIYNDLWQDEYAVLYNYMKREFVDAEPHSLRLRDLSLIKNRILMIKLEAFVEENRRKDALMLLVGNRYLNIHFWSRIIFVILGRKIWYMLRLIK